jgi:hypothetical protein
MSKKQDRYNFRIDGHATPSSPIPGTFTVCSYADKTMKRIFNLMRLHMTFEAKDVDTYTIHIVSSEANHGK